MSLEALHTVQEAARILRVHRITVLRWIQRGLLPTVRPPGCRKHLITESALADLIAAYSTQVDPAVEQARLLDDLKRRLAS